MKTKVSTAAKRLSRSHNRNLSDNFKTGFIVCSWDGHGDNLFSFYSALPTMAKDYMILQMRTRPISPEECQELMDVRKAFFARIATPIPVAVSTL